MSLFTKIASAPPLGEEPRGPEKCPTPGCEELDSSWSPTGQCPRCVDEEYARAIAEDTALRSQKDVPAHLRRWEISTMTWGRESDCVQCGAPDGALGVGACYHCGAQS